MLIRVKDKKPNEEMIKFDIIICLNPVYSLGKQYSYGLIGLDVERNL